MTSLRPETIKALVAAGILGSIVVGWALPHPAWSLITIQEKKVVKTVEVPIPDAVVSYRQGTVTFYEDKRQGCLWVMGNDAKLHSIRPDSRYCPEKVPND